MNEYVVAVDIAKKRDFTAIMVLRDAPQIVKGNPILKNDDRKLHFYDVAHMDKFQGLTYQELVERVVFVMNHEKIKNNADLLVDGTGVGEAAVDLLKGAGLHPLSIIFTGGTQAKNIYTSIGSVFKNEPGQLRGAQTLQEIHVPKVDLVSAGVLIMQQGRLRVAPGLRWTDDFRHQLEAFRGKVNEQTKKVKYEAESEEDHDDLVVCYFMGAWWFLRRKEAEEIPEETVEREWKQKKDWNPFDFM